MIVVLTLGRSGSSLIMQTLKILGAEVAGLSFNTHPSPSHIARNPKGYFEDGPLYAHGLKSRSFGVLRDRKIPNAAFKTDLRNFVAPDTIALWQKASAEISCILVSIRVPCEQTRSEYLGSVDRDHDEVAPRASRLEELRVSGEFLQTYRHCFQTLEERLHGPLSGYRERTHAVDYAQARTDPEAYVRHISNCAGLAPTREAFEQAVANIEAGLYRNKQEDLRNTQGLWAGQTGAQASYERIKEILGRSG